MIDKKAKNKNKANKRPKKPLNKRTLIAIVLISISVIIALGIIISRIGKNNTGYENQFGDLSENIPEGIPENPYIGQDIVKHIISATKSTKEALKKRPKTVELTEENMNDFIKVDSCVIDNGQVKLSYSSDGIPKSDDKFYYLFAVNSYDDSMDVNSYDYVTKAYKSENGEMSCALLANTPTSRLYKKFGVAVKIDDNFVMIGDPSFITNPEAIAPHTNVFMAPSSKKGILIDYNKVFGGELEDLGIKQAAMNIPVSSILGPTTNPLFPSIQFSYNGKNYTFNGTVIAGFDTTVATLTSKGITTTAIVLNDYSNANISLIHPDARSAGVCPYYMFNGATDDGVEILSAVGAFLADRYSGSKHGRISNWVIANEINARKEWNYLKYTDVDTYSKEYAKGFRVLYTAIKSNAADGRVFISLDQTWDRNLANSPDYDGKDVLDSFNAYMSKYGNIDWSVAYHPYNIPLTSCKSWAPSQYVDHTFNSPMISMQNIDVLVKYMNQPEFLAPNGECRSIMITELGYTSTAGEQLQAAAIAYAFYKIDNYKDIDGLLLNRHTDDATEIAQGLATGITTAGGGKKLSYDVYKYIDTKDWESHVEFAKSVIGISDWKSLIK